ncbi:hypothetical protein CRENPOLYSF1_340007 [Crenothrix polyspora]|uniref:Uncharacterized protein n=1 Tax=Crenothrix polyspora TaxID=360316 RepID=A0A1R4H9F3_9GAMM|nr:hypothetical protein CRENPOLYSF1_340007 [Crenothrix polyspora]
MFLATTKLPKINSSTSYSAAYYCPTRRLSDYKLLSASAAVKFCFVTV